MKKLLHLMLLCAAFLCGIDAMPQSRESKVTYNKKEVVAAVLDLPFTPDVVQDAIKEYISKKSAKSDRSKGFDVFRHTRLNSHDTEIHDVYCKVEQKSRKQKDEAVVYLFIGKAGEDISARLSTDHYKKNEAKQLLDEMAPHIEAYSLEVDIKNQETQVKKAERKMQGLIDDQSSLEKRIKNLQDQLEQNKIDQEKQAKDMEELKAILTTLMGKRKS